MQKVGIIAHNSLREDLISMLHDEGVLEVRAAGNGTPIDHTTVEYKEAEVQFAIDTLQTLADKQTLAACTKKASIEHIMHTVNSTDVNAIIGELHALEKSDTEAHHTLQELADFKQAVAPWKKLRCISKTMESETTMHILGILPLINEHKLSDSLKQSFSKSILTKVEEIQNGFGTFSAILWKKDVNGFNTLATSLGWTRVQLPPFEAENPAAAYEEASIQEKTFKEVIKKNMQKRQKLAVELPNLLKVKLFMQWMDQKQGVRESMGATDATITLLGWMPAKEIEVLEIKLEKLSPAIAIMKVKPDAGEETPVLLKNRKMIAPFESVTELYGLPLSSEMDPTSALSPFFILYFALCLTDAGYGAVIALIFGITLFITKKSIDEAKLLWLLFFGGIVTFFVSIPFGGWFGLTPEQVPAFLTKETVDGLFFKGQIWNLGHQSGIEFLQNLSLSLGITHMFFGMFLAGQHKWIHGKKAEAFWMDFTAHLLLGSVLFLAFAPEGLHTTALYILYASIAIIIWGKGYGTVWYARPISGLLGMGNFAIGMISNGLSYLRLLALGLVTGAIAAAINQVAVEMGKLFPLWLSIPVIIMIFLVGHTVSIALNTLGSFIHSGRLQFIEFFSQFFEGGGRGFSPFKRTS